MAKKVLVVDDERLIVKGIRFSLEQDGMEVDCAYDGEEALKMATENAYDMVLLDIMLPKMDGFEVCQSIRLCGIGEPDGLTGEPSDDEAGREWGYIRIYAHYNRYAVGAVYAPCIYEIHGWHYTRLSVYTVRKTAQCYGELRKDNVALRQKYYFSVVCQP